MTDLKYFGVESSGVVQDVNQGPTQPLSYTSESSNYKLGLKINLANPIPYKKKMKKNTSLAAKGALAQRLQRRNARTANEANIYFPNIKMEITSL